MTVKAWEKTAQERGKVKAEPMLPTRVKFLCVTKKEAMFERPRLNVKLSENQLLRLRAIFHTLPLVSCLYFIYALYGSKNYSTVRGIHLKKGYKQVPARSIK